MNRKKDKAELVQKVAQPSDESATSAEAQRWIATSAEMRHQLRTPLNHIIGYSEMLIEEADENQLERFAADMRKIHAAGKQLLADLNQLFGSKSKQSQPVSAHERFPAGEIASRPTALVDSMPGVARFGRILVVDDDARNRDLLVRRLEHEGYTVQAAARGEAALARLATESVDLILLDIMMPGMSGYEVLEAIKRESQWRDIPVIMISALDELQSVVRCIEHGAEDYLPKPFDPVLLHARIGACLEKKRLRDQEVLYLTDVTQVTQAATTVEEGNFTPESLSSVAARSDELGRLARVFQRMALEVQAREQRLTQQIQELHIEIDEVKKARQVAEITETDYFHDLREKARTLRNKVRGT
jgi:DNA-binding response OmpR family regulator